MSTTTRATPGTLSRDALAAIRDAGLTRQQYVDEVGRWQDGQWHGDRCGCTDDRCIGYHHDATDACGCLPALLTEVLDERGLADGSRVRVEHDCYGPYAAYWRAQGREPEEIRHSVVVPVRQRTRLGCGCTRIDTARCDGRPISTFDQVCPREHE